MLDQSHTTRFLDRATHALTPKVSLGGVDQEYEVRVVRRWGGDGVAVGLRVLSAGIGVVVLMLLLINTVAVV
jgi:hypothetical protein